MMEFLLDSSFLIPGSMNALYPWLFFKEQRHRNTCKMGLSPENSQLYSTTKSMCFLWIRIIYIGFCSFKVLVTKEGMPSQEHTILCLVEVEGTTWSFGILHITQPWRKKAWLFFFSCNLRGSSSLACYLWMVLRVIPRDPASSPLLPLALPKIL